MLHGKSTARDHLALAKRAAVLLVVAGLMIVGYTRFGDTLSLENLAKQESQLRSFQQDDPLLVSGTAFLIYVAVTGLSLPFATALTLVIGWLIGFWRGLLLVSFASTAGATLAFLLSRYLLGNYVQAKFSDQIARFDAAIKREGAFYLFTLRLIAGVPFWVINVVMGLTPIRTTTFWWVSQLGMLPGTCVFVLAGSRAPTLNQFAENGIRSILTWDLILAFALLGVFPLIVKQVVRMFRSPNTQSVESSPTDGRMSIEEVEA